MYRGLALAAACIAMSTAAGWYAARDSSARLQGQLQRIVRLETDLAALRAHRGSAPASDSAPRAVQEDERDEASLELAPGAPSAREARVRGNRALQESRGIAGALQSLSTEEDATARAQSAHRLLQTPPEQVTLYAARTLLELDPAQGVEAIAELVQSSRLRAGSVRTAIEAISLLRDVEDPAAQPALEGYARDASPLIRAHAAKILRGRGNAAPLEGMVREYTTELASADHRSRLAAISMLGFVAEPSTLPELVPLLQDENSEIRLRTIAALGRFQDVSLRSSLSPLVDDPVPQVRAAARAAVRRLE